MSISMKEETEKFNNILNEFLDKMVNKFPKSQRISKYRKKFLLMRFSNPKACPHLFMTSVSKYKTQIETRDENFFLNDQQFIEKASYFASYNITSDIKIYWSDLIDDEKKAIWDYMQTLLIMGEIIINKNKEFYEKCKNIEVSDKEVKDMCDINEESEENIKKFNDDILNKLQN